MKYSMPEELVQLVVERVPEDSPLNREAIPYGEDSLLAALHSWNQDLTLLPWEAMETALLEVDVRFNGELFTEDSLRQLLTGLTLEEAISVTAAFDRLTRNAMKDYFCRVYGVRRLTKHTYPRLLSFVKAWCQATEDSRRECWDTILTDVADGLSMPADWVVSMAGWDYDGDEKLVPWVDRVAEDFMADADPATLAMITVFNQTEMAEGKTKGVPKGINTGG